MTARATRIAVSGHRGYTPEVAELIDRAVREQLAQYTPVDLVLKQTRT